MICIIILGKIERKNETKRIESNQIESNQSKQTQTDPTADHLNLFNNRNTQIKKKRKSRTAFTNHQIFELEKRFLYQKYLSPADRDEIAQSLGLTNAQVITWLVYNSFLVFQKIFHFYSLNLFIWKKKVPE